MFFANNDKNIVCALINYVINITITNTVIVIIMVPCKILPYSYWQCRSKYVLLIYVLLRDDNNYIKYDYFLLKIILYNVTIKVNKIIELCVIFRRNRRTK